MSVLVLRKDLLRALEALKPVVKGGAPLLQSIRLDVQEGLPPRPDVSRVILSGTDLHHSLSYEIAPQVCGKDISVLVEHARLHAWAKADWGEEVEFGVEEGRLLAQGATTARFHVKTVEDFPTLPLPPAEPEWVRLSPEAVGEIGQAVRFCRGEQAGKYRTLLERFVYLYEEAGQLVVFAGGGHAAWFRFGLGEVPQGFALTLGKEAAGMLASLAGEEGVEVMLADLYEGESGKPRHEYFRGEGWTLAEVRPEEVGDPHWIITSCKPDVGVRVIGKLSELIRALEAMPEWEQGEKAPVKIEEELLMASSAAETRECRLETGLPRYWTYYPSLLVALLRQLERVAGEEGRVEVASFGGANLRFEVPGKALALASGVFQA